VYLPKLPKDLLLTEFASLEITRPDKRHRTRMTKSLPEVLRSLYRNCWAWAAYGFTGDDAAAFVVKRHNHELDDFGHSSFPSTPAEERNF
jgi:hypothetical protein